jgi:hypothetical protein
VGNPSGKKESGRSADLKRNRNMTAKKVIRTQTRKAGGATPTNKGLGITKNEGGKTLQAAIKKVGYQKAKGVVKRTTKNLSAKSSRGHKAS